MLSHIVSVKKMDELIHRLLRRVGSAREKRSVWELAEFQDRWGLQLSEFFVRLYSEVGDGGFGPGYAGIAPIEHLEVELKDAASDPCDNWPKLFVEFAQYGCSQCAGIDLGDPTNPVHYIDGDAGRGGSVRLCFSLPRLA